MSRVFREFSKTRLKQQHSCSLFPTWWEKGKLVLMVSNELYGGDFRKTLWLAFTYFIIMALMYGIFKCGPPLRMFNQNIEIQTILFKCHLMRNAKGGKLQLILNYKTNSIKYLGKYVIAEYFLLLFCLSPSWRHYSRVIMSCSKSYIQYFVETQWSYQGKEGTSTNIKRNIPSHSLSRNQAFSS